MRPHGGTTRALALDLYPLLREQTARRAEKRMRQLQQQTPSPSCPATRPTHMSGRGRGNLVVHVVPHVRDLRAD